MAALLLAVVAILFFAPEDFQGKVLQQHDMMQGVANGQEGKAFHEATGETTRWTNSLFSGMPTFQIAPSYPANSMLGWIGSLFTLWLPSPANLLFGMMLGFFIMCLCMKMRWPTALFGAVAWGLSTYFIIIIGAGHIWKFLTLMYIPPTIGGIALCYRGRYLPGVAIASLFGALQLGSNHPQMSYYFLFVLLFLAIGWLVVAIRQGKVRQWCLATVCSVAAGGLALLANSASLYNSYEYAAQTVRGRATELSTADGGTAKAGMDRDAITAWSYGLDETFTLLIPNVKGGATIKPVGGENKLKSVLDTDRGQSSYLTPEENYVAGQFAQYFGDQPMTNGPVYVGAFVLMLAILAMFVVNGEKQSPVKWSLFAVSVLAILLSWGHNASWLTDFFIDHFPGYNKFRAVASILVIVEFCLPLLAAMTLMKIADERGEFLQRNKWTFYAVMGAGAFICLLGWLCPTIFGSPYSVTEMNFITENGLMGNPAYANVLATISESRLGLVRADSLRSLIYILIGSGICLLYMKGAFRNRSLFACCVTALVLIDLFSVNKRYVDGENFVEPVNAQSTLEMRETDRQILADKDPNYRVLDLDDFGGARTSYFHKSIGGYHAAKLTRYNDLINSQILKGNPAVLNMLNTRYIVSQGSVQRNPDALGNAWFVDAIDYVSTPDAEMKALDALRPDSLAVADVRFKEVLGQAAPVSAGDTVYETSYAPNALSYKARSAKGGIAVFSEIYFPWGWQATIDGKPAEIGRVDYVLRALRVPAGEHDIEFRFDPESLKITNGISIASVSVIYILCAIAIGAGIVAGKRRRREQTDTH